MARKIVLDENTKHLAIGIGIALTALILSYAMYQSYARRIKAKHSEINKARQKLALRKDVTKLDNLIIEYREYLPKDPNIDTLRDRISGLARKAAVDIISMQPQDPERFGSYIKISFKVKLRCSYSQLGKFLEGLEKLSTLTKVDEIRATESASYAAGRDEFSLDEAVKADIFLTISAYCVQA